MSFVKLVYGVEIATVTHWSRARAIAIRHGEKEEAHDWVHDRKYGLTDTAWTFSVPRFV